MQDRRSEDRPRLSEDDRFELVSIAETARRRGRPVHLVVLAGSLLVAGGLGLAWTVSQRVAAEASVGRERAKLASAEVRIAELERLKDRDPSSGSEDTVWPRETQMLSTLKRLSEEAGLSDLPIARDFEDSVTLQGRASDDVKRRRWVYRGVQAQDLAQLTDWIARVRLGVPGIYVTEFQVQPTASGWSIDVTFARLEQTR